LGYALNGKEVTMILNDKEGHIKVDNKVRKDNGFPTGVMDVISIEKTKEHFRVLYDVKGRWVLKSLKEDEAQFKLCKVVKKCVGPNKVPYIVTNDGRTIRYAHPDIQVHDTIKLNLIDNKIVDHVKFEIGNVVYVTSGNNVGRVGIMTVRDRHYGSFDIIHIRDTLGRSFATRLSNVFIIGKGKKPWISLPKDNGIYMSALESKQNREKKPTKDTKAKH
jgi:small subunit ribosomal protein S4e